MQSYRKTEITVGIFVFLGIVSMAWMAIKLGQVGGLGASGYTVSATFEDAGGLRAGADVMLAGVSIGRVASVSLVNQEEALLKIEIQEGVKLASDVIASVRTKGIIGEKYVRITQGSEDDILEDQGEIDETESAINIEDLVSKYIFSSDE